MKIERTAPDMVTCELSLAELTVIGNCLNETMEALDDWEFQSRVGVERGDVRQLHAAIREIVRDESTS